MFAMFEECKSLKYINLSNFNINPLTSPGEVITVFTYPYLSAWAPVQGEAKGLIGKVNA